MKDLLPLVFGFTKELAADQAAMDALEDKIRREKELAGNGRNGKDRKSNDEAVKRMHDQILRAPVNGSVAAKALMISELLNVEKWEMNAGNPDAICSQIIVPELRASRDPRLLEFWDMRLKRESEAVAKTQLAFEMEKFTKVRRPEILWSRVQDVLLLGQRNRALGEMLSIVKTWPSHPRANDWVAEIEQIIAPPRRRGHPCASGSGTASG